MRIMNSFFLKERHLSQNWPRRRQGGGAIPVQTPLFTRLPAAAFLLGLLRSPGPRTPDQDTVVFPADVCHHAALAARTLKSEDNDTQETPRCPTEPLPKGSQKPPGRKQPRPTVSPTFAQDDSVSSPATAAAADTHSSPRCQRRSPAPVGRKLQWRGQTSSSDQSKSQ